MIKKRILLIEDEPMVRELIEAMLEMLEQTVTSFETPVEALTYFEEKPSEFDLVITDHSMPTMTGLVLAQKIKEVRPDIPVVITTGHSSSQIQRQMEGNGTYLVLEKPFSLQKLEKIVQSV